MLLSFLIFGKLSANNTLTETAQISLITVGPGDALYSSFGHSALWVEDSTSGISVVFNYGVFDFDTPGFYVKFMRGKLDYMLAAGRISYLVNSAKEEKRTVIKQVLNLNLQEKQAVFDFLLNNIKPGNKYYQYDFFYDNCSTRFRDLFEQVLGDGLEWRRDAEGITLRDFLDIYLAEKPWQDFGIDLVLGAPTDKLASKADEMFLPDLLMYHIDEAYVDGKPLLQDKQVIYEAPSLVTESSFSILPKHVTWLLCIVGIIFSMRHFKSNFNDVIFNRFLFFISGILGLLIFFLWFLSDHQATVNNWNIIWAFPLNAFLIFFLFKKPAKKWHTLFYACFGIACFLLLGFFYTLPQALHPAVFPLVLYFAFKSFNLLYSTKKMNV
ncbi:MAG: hypothetical protein ACJAT1_001027 [Marivirga sp.]